MNRQHAYRIATRMRRYPSRVILSLFTALGVVVMFALKSLDLKGR